MARLIFGGDSPVIGIWGTMAQLFPPATASGRLRAQSHLRGAVGHHHLTISDSQRVPVGLGLGLPSESRCPQYGPSRFMAPLGPATLEVPVI